MERTTSPAAGEDRPLRVVVSTIVSVFVVCALYTTVSLAGIKSDLDVIAHASRTATVGEFPGVDAPRSVSLIKRSDISVSTNDLVEHPHLSGLLTLPMVYPNNTVTKYDEEPKQKRYLWWVIGAIWKTAETGIALRALVKDCEDWSNGDADRWGKFSCVYGAVSTLLTVAGAGWGGYQYGAAIFRTLRDFWYKRDVDTDYETRVLDLLIHYQVSTVNHTGLPWTPVFDLQGNLLVDTRVDSSPILFGYDFEGIPAHMSYNYIGGDNHTVAMNFMHQAPTNSSLTRREVFNDQDFDQGGLEAGFIYNQNADGGWLDTGYDYNQMYDEVSCYFGDLSNNGLEFQIYDNNHHGTIAAGNVRACEYGAYDTGSLFSVDAPIPINDGCAVS